MKRNCYYSRRPTPWRSWPTRRPLASHSSGASLSMNLILESHCGQALKSTVLVDATVALWTMFRICSSIVPESAKRTWYMIAQLLTQILWLWLPETASHVAAITTITIWVWSRGPRGALPPLTIRLDPRAASTCSASFPLSLRQILDMARSSH